MVLTSLPNVLEIIMKYVSLSAIANIPRFYYNSLVDYKLLIVSKLEIDFKIFRRDKMMKDAPIGVKFMRVLHKSMRIIFCFWSYYFMPFTALFLTYFIVGVDQNKLEESQTNILTY